MAKMTVTVDTETQETSVDIDGKAVVSPAEVVISNWGNNENPMYTFNVTMYEKEGGVYKTTRLQASLDDDAKRAIAAGTGRKSQRYPGMIECPGKTREQSSFEEMWSRR